MVTYIINKDASHWFVGFINPCPACRKLLVLPPRSLGYIRSPGGFLYGNVRILSGISDTLVVSGEGATAYATGRAGMVKSVPLNHLSTPKAATGGTANEGAGLAGSLSL
jgi:hypothetical protein